jgi:hypothetical protein
MLAKGIKQIRYKNFVSRQKSKVMLKEDLNVWTFEAASPDGRSPKWS